MINSESNNTFFQRGIHWIQQQTRRLFRTDSPELARKQNSHILKFPNLQRDPHLARIQGLKRAREKMGLARVQERTKELLRKENIRRSERVELNCPICMQPMVGPVSTPCGHSFCWDCLDEALILSAVCPVCRLNIQKTQFVRCRELQSIIIDYLNATPHFNHYQERLEIFQKWLSKRYLTPGRVHPSDLVDVRDTEGIWCGAIVKELLKVGETPSLLIHYIGWSGLYDEVIETESPRLASYRFYTGRANVPRYEVQGEHQLQGYVLGLEERMENLDSDESLEQIVIRSESSSPRDSNPEQESFGVESARQLQSCGQD